jgi:hypothetical protein
VRAAALGQEVAGGVARAPQTTLTPAVTMPSWLSPWPSACGGATSGQALAKLGVGRLTPRVAC